MDKQLNFLNIFDEEKYKKDAANEVEGTGELNMDEGIDEKDILEKDPIEFDKFEKVQKEEADHLVRETERIAHNKELENFILELRKGENRFRLSDFEPFLSDLKQYHRRFEFFRKDLQEAKPGPEKEKIYKKIVNPSAEDDPEFRNIASLYLIYIEKLKELKPGPQKNRAVNINKKSIPKIKKKSSLWSSPRLDQGKDAAAGAYLDYKDE